jgi:hypothetical protein
MVWVHYDQWTINKIPWIFAQNTLFGLHGILKLHGHDNTHLNNNKKGTILTGWIEENVIYECEIAGKLELKLLEVGGCTPDFFNFKNGLYITPTPFPTVPGIF